jgi:hypothetical protein
LDGLRRLGLIVRLEFIDVGFLDRSPFDSAGAELFNPYTRTRRLSLTCGAHAMRDLWDCVVIGLGWRGVETAVSPLDEVQSLSLVP